MYYYRQEKKGALKKGTWKGPAVVVGHQGVNHWVAHGGFTKLVAAEHLRPADPEELWWPLGIDASTDPEAEIRAAGARLDEDPEVEISRKIAENAADQVNENCHTYPADQLKDNCVLDFVNRVNAKGYVDLENQTVQEMVA